jgi:hypothetical protein
MLPTRRLLQQACRITLFTRHNCGLCSQAKEVLSTVWDKRPFAYQEVDLAKPASEPWKNLYDFDIPVVSRFILASSLEFRNIGRLWSVMVVMVVMLQSHDIKRYRLATKH